jgi:hypothetical protein
LSPERLLKSHVLARQPHSDLITGLLRSYCRQWVVRDPEGSFWILPSVNHPWEHRQPFHPTPETDLEPVPGHYKDMLELPF